ncbi:hypothetical protein EV652_10372 [Kribbella steppae]|uniref:Uncharacterized protein n=1 Tax=Kribbella steppae TaxID=2512223 RepID=A0A4R2HPF0_9ACTN|nr:hypothetical protein [Kribbella steppae]TCO33073.1 hypothetical protein EV652_10372 [Kribbella steppae]
MIWYLTGSRLATGLSSIAAVIYVDATLDSRTLDGYLSRLAPVELATLLPAIAITWLSLDAIVSFGARYLRGEWPARSRTAARVRAFAIRRHVRRYERLRDRARKFQEEALDSGPGRQPTSETEWLRASMLEFSSSYPRGIENITATRLSNTLKAAEERLNSRYGMDATVVLPRLTPILPTRLEKRVDAKSGAIDFWVRLAVLLTVVSSFVFVSMFLPSAPRLTLLGLVVLLVSTTVAAYRVSISCAHSYCVEVEVAFDLHRIQLLEAMSLPAPKGLEHQRELFHLVSLILLGASQDDVKFIYEKVDKKLSRGEWVEINNFSVGQAAAVGNRPSVKAQRIRFTSGKPVKTRGRINSGGSNA